MRVVLDTNVLVSGLAYPDSVPGRIISLWRRGGMEVVLSRYILDEMVRVLPRLPRLRLTAQEIGDLADSFLFLADIFAAQAKHELPTPACAEGKADEGRLDIRVLPLAHIAVLHLTVDPVAIGPIVSFEIDL